MEKSKKQTIYKIIMAVALTALLTFMATSVFMYNVLGEKGNKFILLPSNNSKVSAVDKTIQAIRSVIDKNYIETEKIDENEVVQGAIKGYVAGLGDEYSEYMTEKEWTEYQADSLGNFEGIGIYGMNDTEHNNIVIIAPVPESAAEKAGLKSGDIVKKVDGITYTGKQLEEAMSKIKGVKGTTVKLEILREEATLNFEIVRELVRTSPITTKVLEKNIGYMQFLTFDSGIGEDFISKYNELAAKGVKGLIIDVRFNGGGYVKGATDILETLLPKDKITLVTNSKKDGEIIYKTKEDNEIKMPVVLLINEYSASATEVLAGALKDNQRAKLVGTKTYGKGVLQNIFFIDGNALKLTTDEFFTPNRNKINKTGIEPDVVVELPEKYRKTVDIPYAEDTQLQKAVSLLSIVFEYFPKK